MLLVGTVACSLVGWVSWPYLASDARTQRIAQPSLQGAHRAVKSVAITIEVDQLRVYDPIGRTR